MVALKNQVDDESSPNAMCNAESAAAATAKIHAVVAKALRTQMSPVLAHFAHQLERK